MNPALYLDIIRSELTGIYGYAMTQEIDEIISYYEIYEGKRYTPGAKHPPSTNIIKKLIDDEARYMCARPPELRIMPRNPADQQQADQLTEWIEDTLAANQWQRQLLSAVRDSLIGKRVALKLTCDARGRIRLRFAPALEFIYDPDEDVGSTAKRAVFYYYTTPDTVTERRKMRIWKQRYTMEHGHCILSEGVYDGYGTPIEITHNESDTGLDFVPIYVVINGGLTGDLIGESDVGALIGNQEAYDRTKADDIEALKYQMFGQKAFIDASPESVEAVKIAPNAMLDIQTEPGSPHQAKVEMIETTFAYGDHMDKTLERLKDDMHNLLSVPRITPDMLTGLGTSGKAMRALYWELNCRCEEKWSSGWDDMLRWMVSAMLRIARRNGAKLPEIDYRLGIEHLYPIMDDDQEERQIDLQEVNAQARSRRSYIDKWQVDSDTDGEMRQIEREKRMFEDAFEGAITAEYAGRS